MVPAKIYFSLIKIVFLSLFSENYKIIFNQFIKTNSFRIHGNNNILLPLKIILKNIIILFSPKVKKQIVDDSTRIKNVFFSSRSKLNDVYDQKNFYYRFEYVKRIKKFENPDIAINRESLYIKNISQKLLIIFIQTISILFLFPFYLFFKSLRNVISLHYTQNLEWVSIINNLRELKGKNLYLFDAYENDSSFISYLAINESYSVFMFPSAIPLIYFYKYFYCTHFVLSSPYHNNELKKLDFNYKCESFIESPIDEFVLLTNAFNKKNHKNYDYELGSFTSASWLSNEMNLMTDHSEHYNSEIKTYNFLKTYIKDFDLNKVIILLHPKEKKDEKIFEKSKNFYRDLFEINNLKFGHIDSFSYDYYNKIDVKICSSIATHSSIIFCGYKSIYSALSLNKNEFAKSNFLKTIAFNEESLKKKINLHCKISNEDFIRENNLTNYIYKYYENIAEYR